MTLAIARQVSEFTSDTIQTTSENTALPTKRLFLNSFCNSSKRSSAPSAPPLTLAMLESESRHITQKEINNVFFLHLASHKRLVYNGKKKRKKVLEVKRGHTVLPPSNHLVNHMCVCISLSMPLLPRPSPPCQPPLPTTAPQLRCDHCSRPKWVQWSHHAIHRGRGRHTHHSSKKRRREKERGK